MFASRSLTEHLIRGGLGVAALVLGLYLADRWWLALLLLPAALVAFRGCPMCWTVGLMETLGRSSRSAACPTRVRPGGAPSSDGDRPA